jgi:hypothetical protein
MFWRMERTNMIQVLLDIEGFEDGDAAERYALALELEAVLSDMDVEDVSWPQGRAPQGAKGTSLEWGALIVGPPAPFRWVPPLPQQVSATKVRSFTCSLRTSG